MAAQLLADKVAIVTGSGRGLGRGMALALASEGAHIVVCGRTIETLNETAQEVRARNVRALIKICDIREEDQLEDLVKTTVAEFGRIDILINNAATHAGGLLLDVEYSQFADALRSGPLAALRLMQLCHPYLKGGGVIINLATGAQIRADPVGYGCYAAPKGATHSLTRAAAVEWGKDGIRVHAIAPLAGLEKWFKLKPDEAAEYAKQIPLGRIGDSETDIGPVVVFLCGPDSGYMTGNIIMVDGGKEFLR